MSVTRRASSRNKIIVVRCLRSILCQPAHSVGIGGLLSILTVSDHVVAVQPETAALMPITMADCKTSLHVRA
ncbi:hypothetical protein J2782_002668 [Brucella pseudogrignonensis]|uniref:Uncharacterized protein n=1 Tax=Brucella pseudogrignonensis TaxID=419475 RepID=A0ABU1MA42_9HYPH|nr:hypothetical protein [Brucella pseudogrignonensis]